MKCQKCGAESPEGSKVCMMCGNPFNKQKRCPNCGAIIVPGAVFCTNCGQKQGMPTQNRVKPAKDRTVKKHTLRNVLIAVAAVIAIFIFLGGNSKNDQKEKNDYPIKSSYSSEDFSKAPEIIYTTTAEDNEHGNELMFVEGTLGKPFKKKGQNVCEVTTEEGKIAIISMPLVTPSGAWKKVNEGELVRVNFMYLGYSDVLDEASGALISIEETTPESSSAAVRGIP